MHVMAFLSLFPRQYHKLVHFPRTFFALNTCCMCRHNSIVKTCLYIVLLLSARNENFRTCVGEKTNWCLVLLGARCGVISALILHPKHILAPPRLYIWQTTFRPLPADIYGSYSIHIRLIMTTQLHVHGRRCSRPLRTFAVVAICAVSPVDSP